MKIILESMQDIADFKELVGGGCKCKDVVVEAPKKETKKKTAKKEEPKVEKVEELKEEPKVEKVEAEKVGIDETPTETKETDATTISKEDVQNACKEKIKAGKTKEVKEIIKSHGATNISSIDEKDYASVIAEVEAL